jgi:hypothetical protein
MYEICFSPSHTAPPFRWFYDVNSAKTHQIGYLLSPNIPISGKLMTANIITYIFYCCLVLSHFVVLFSDIIIRHDDLNTSNEGMKNTLDGLLDSRMKSEWSTQMDNILFQRLKTTKTM